MCLDLLSCYIQDKRCCLTPVVACGWEYFKIPSACAYLFFFFVPKAKKNIPTYVLTRPHCTHVKLVLLVLLNLFKSEIRSIFHKNVSKQYHQIFFLPQTHSSYFRFSHLVGISFEMYFIFLLVWGCYCRAMHINVAGFKKPKCRESTLHFPSIWQRE